ncbi:HD domain-containing protein [Streptomyces sp. NPDC091268]|uniref:HD domain-containing protein n=1 Tax=Streptomyces sp. NPDC091268 TaxID=3365979 RepID=UPI003808A7CC
MTSNEALCRALRDPGDPPVRPLPREVAELLLTLTAPPRLAAHLRLVHDVAYDLADWLSGHCPELPFDRGAVLFGAATHDVGKAVHTGELTGPGSAHEPAGRDLLVAHGFGAERARFAATHASWAQARVSLEELLVSTADKVWKGKRVPELEDLLIGRIAGAGGVERWEAYLALDELLGRIAEGAQGRLAFQAAHPV